MFNKKQYLRVYWVLPKNWFFSEIITILTFFCTCLSFFFFDYLICQKLSSPTAVLFVSFLTVWILFIFDSMLFST